MKSEDILIYILIPAYKTEKFIDDCISSILVQDYNNWRAIIVDDGSPDNVGAICDSYAKKNNKIRVIHQKNLGLLAARRTAISAVLEEDINNESYVIFLDSDDKLKENALSTIYYYLKNSQCDLLIYGYDIVNNGNIVYSSTEEDKVEIDLRDKHEIFRTAIIDKTYNSLWRKAVKSELLLNDDFSKWYGVQIGEDLIQSLPLYDKSSYIKVIPNSLYLYLDNFESMTKEINVDRYIDDLNTKQFTLEYVHKRKIWKEEDYQDYAFKCLGTLEGWIKQIGENLENNHDKIKIFERISAHVFYNKFLAKYIKYDIYLWLFDKKYYGCLLYLFKMRTLVKKLIK